MPNRFHAVLPLLTLATATAAAGPDLEDASFVRTPSSPRAPRLVISTDPIGWMDRTYALSTSAALGERAAVRADARFTEATEYMPGSSSWRLGVSLPIFLDRTFEGPYVEPGLAIRRAVVAGLGAAPLGGLGGAPLGGLAGYPVVQRSFGPEVYVGWQWSFRSRLSVAAAIGASRSWTAPASSPTMESYVRVGYAL